MQWARAKCEKVAALGRPFALGQLYDIQQHRIVQGAAWPVDAIKRMTVRRDGPPEVSYSFNFESKKSQRTERLEMSAELRFAVEFLFWKKTFTGSARNLTDVSSYQSRDSISFQYDVKNAIEELQYHGEDAELMGLPENTSATHIVTGISFGGKAFIVCNGFTNATEFMETASAHVSMFETTVKDAIKGMGRSAKSILGTNLPEHSYQSSAFEVCECYTDFKPPSRTLMSPKDALQYIKELRSRDAKTPIDIYLTPIEYFFTKRQLRIPQRNPEHLKIVCDYMDELQEAVEETECRLKEISATDCETSQLKKSISDYQSDLKQYMKAYKMQLGKEFSNMKKPSSFFETHENLSRDTRFSPKSVETSLKTFGRLADELLAHDKRLQQCTEEIQSTDAVEKMADDLVRKADKLVGQFAQLNQQSLQLSQGSKTIKIRQVNFVKKNVQEEKNVTWCIKCQRSCHDSCVFDNDEGKKDCQVMTDGVCSECDCEWKQHRNKKDYFVKEVIEAHVTETDLADRYDIDMQEAGATMRLQQQLSEKVKLKLQLLACNLKEAHSCLKRLQPEWELSLQQFARQRIDTNLTDEADRIDLANRLSDFL